MYVNDRADLIRPFQLAGTKFVDYVTRYSPKVYYIYSPDGGVRLDYYAIAGSHTTYPDTANSASSHFIKPGEWYTFTGISSDAHTARFNCSGNVIISSYNAAGDQHMLYPCSKEVISGEETAPNTMTFLSTGTVLNNGKYYYSFNDLVQTQINGDGAGSSCLQGLPVSMMKDTYIIAHTLQNLQLTSIYKGTITISYYTGGVWSLKEVVSINGSIEAPDRVELGTGDSAGGLAYLNADLIIIHGTVPFVCRTNDLADVEYYPLGYRTAHRHLYY